MDERQGSTQLMGSLSFRESVTTYKVKSRQRGQIMVLAMLSIVPLSMLIAYILNGGELVPSKTRIQNAVDTAVLTEASWVARSLNAMSMNNTAITQSMAISTAGYALEGPMINAGFDAGLCSSILLLRLQRK